MDGLEITLVALILSVAVRVVIDRRQAQRDARQIGWLGAVITFVFVSQILNILSDKSVSRLFGDLSGYLEWAAVLTAPLLVISVLVHRHKLRLQTDKNSMEDKT